MLGRAEVHEGGAEAARLLEELRVQGEKTLAERAPIVHVEWFDWTSPQHLVPRSTQAELSELLSPMRERIAVLESENTELQVQNATLRGLGSH